MRAQTDLKNSFEVAETKSFAPHQVRSVKEFNLYRKTQMASEAKDHFSDSHIFPMRPKAKFVAELNCHRKPE